jgi:hypothetical protein
MSPFWIVMLSAYVVAIIVMLTRRVKVYTTVYSDDYTDFHSSMYGRKEYAGYKEGWLYGGEKVWAFIAPALALSFIGAMTYSLAPTTGYEKTHSFNIVALGSSTAGGGRAYLGAGASGRYQTYAFMYRTQDGGYKMGSREAQVSTVYQDAEPNTARIEKWVGTNGFLGGRTSLLPIYRIHIPKGSIVQGYNVDVTN